MFKQKWNKQNSLSVSATFSQLILLSLILTRLMLTFYYRTPVLMSMPAVLQLMCGSSWLLVQSHRHFITIQSLFALHDKQRYCAAMCLHLVTLVTLSCFVCTLFMFFCKFKTFWMAFIQTPSSLEIVMSHRKWLMTMKVLRVNIPV